MPWNCAATYEIKLFSEHIIIKIYFLSEQSSDQNKYVSFFLVLFCKYVASKVCLQGIHFEIIFLYISSGKIAF